METNIRIKPIENKRWNKIKKVEVDFNLKKPFNNFIIPLLVLQKGFDEAFKKRVLIVRNKDEIIHGAPKILDIIGIGINYEITKDLKILVDVEPRIDTELFDCFKLSVLLAGNYNHKRIVNDINLYGFYLAGSRGLINLKSYEDETKTT